MRRLLAMMVVLGVARLAWTATGGPDAEGWEWIDSDEAEGPPHAVLDIDDEGERLGADTGWVDLPFEVDWYGVDQDRARITDDGALFFDALPGAVSCPSVGAWSGVAALWAPGSAKVRTATLGDHPRRLFVVDWQDLQPTGAPGTGRVQLWLQEDRHEVVLALDDLDFGGAAWDGGAAAVVGVQGPATGLAWSCTGGLSGGVSAHFGDPQRRPAAAEVGLEQVEITWTGAQDYEYLGGALAAGDLNGDGLSELVLGAPDGAEVVLTFGGVAPLSGASSGAEVQITGDSGDKLGAALVVADLDGDGVADLAVGEPGADSPSTDAGAVHLLTYDGWVGSARVSTLADATLTPPAGSTQSELGSALAAADQDGDGYLDLAIGAPGDDAALTNAGAVWLWAGGPSWSGGSVAGSPALLGDDTGLKVGGALAFGDLDGDGAAELALGAGNADLSATDAGAGWVVAGGALGGSHDLPTLAQASFAGGAALDYLGTAVLLGDLDGDGTLDLALGAPRADAGGTNAGAALIYLDAGSWLGAWAAADADHTVLGAEAAALLGTRLAAADLDGDGDEELIVGGPGAGASAGEVWVFGDLGSATLTAADADHTLVGAYAAGGAGGALAAVPDLDGDGYPELAVGARFASAGGYTLSGAVSVWEVVPSWLDEDGDGLLSTVARGPDCDDDDAGVYPGAPEDTALEDLLYATDADCDGWADGGYKLRLRADEFAWDLDAVLGGPEAERFDFESGTAGSSVAALYAGNGLTLSASNTALAQSDAFGAAAVGRLCAELTPGASSNTLTLSFDAGVDALSLRLLDAGGELTLEALDEDGDPVADSGGALRLRHDGEDVPGGRFVGVVFGRAVREVVITAEPSDGWGLDNLDVVWAEDSDRDGDGLTGLGGDCDDSAATVYPGAPEDLGNGVDDDCDGVVDGGGATLYTDLSTWALESGITPQLIDFEDLGLGASVGSDYAALGATFDGSPLVVSAVDGAAPNGAQGARARLGVVVITFEEVQPAVALQLLDAQGGFTVTGSLAGTPLYTSTLSLSADDLAGGATVAYVFDLGIDTLTVQGPALDVWGLDDLQLSALGLDDADGDGFTEATGDCDDQDADAYPGGEETWYDGVDGDCDGASDYDADADGFDLGEDCDDVDGAVHPDAEEVFYDGVDGDCDGLSDYDADGDGHDRDTDGGGDCDDADAAVSPDAPEVFYDGVDDNCDPTDDDDADGDGFSAPGGAGGLFGSGDCDDADATTYPSAGEAWYDGVDSDCAGDSDYDQDLDGFDAVAWGGDDCDDLDAGVNPDATEHYYDGIDQDCDGASDFDADLDGYDGVDFGGLDCDDADAAISPDATERDPTDGIDDDCDGTDEWDYDGDGHRGAERGGDDCDDADAAISPSAAELCYDGADQDCDGTDDDLDCDEDGHDALAYGGDDCDDTTAAISPSAPEYAYDGVDQNCDGIDDYDFDGDGHQVEYYGGTDCDDTDPTIYLGAPETWYDGVDSDCDGRSDFDQDLDGYESADHGGADCDDTDAARNPGEIEVPYDGVDQNCDGADATDGDGDGHAALAEGGLDCDDTDATVYPGAPETWYDGVDQDCLGGSDYDQDGDGQDAAAWGGRDCDDTRAWVYAGASERWYDGVDQDCAGDDDYDQDADGYTIAAWGGGDCDDTDRTVHPGAVDGCGLGDQDCDGERDEDCPQDTGDTGGPVDTGDSGDSGDSAWETGLSGDSGEDGGPDSGLVQDSSAPPVEEPGCGCGVGARGGGTTLLLAALGLRRRRERVNPAR